MSERLLGTLFRRFGSQGLIGEDGPTTDAALLDQFLTHQDGEPFAALVDRHGPMVLGVCRRVLDHTEDAEDAFQATFLVLARRANTIRKRTSVASWLYGVADHLSRKLRTTRSRRRVRERSVTVEMMAPTPAQNELRPLLEEELARLPEKYRAPLLLCYYEGRTNEETAAQLCWRPGTVKSRLARARELLRVRLGRRGLALSATAVAALLTSRPATASIPLSLTLSTTRSAVLVAAGSPLGASGVTKSVAYLVEGMMRTILLQRCLTAVAVVLGLCVAGGGSWLMLRASPTVDTASQPAANDDSQPGKAKPSPARTEPAPAAPAEAAYPRRMMAVAPANYAYANPIAYGSNERSLNTIFKKLAAMIRVPASQLVILSDRAEAPMPPVKDVIEENVRSFLQSCRKQDRVVLVFVGHAIEKNGKGYFMPIEGEADDESTLIPLDWFYNQLKACPAQQKVFVVDVCRYDPSRGDERGKVEPMGEKFDEALKNPPEGVQVLTACRAGEYSYEIESRGNIAADLSGVEGGIMFNLVPDIAFKGSLKGVIQKPEDAIPVEALERKLEQITKTYTSLLLKKTQTTRLSGKATEGAVPYDPKEAVPAKFKLKLTNRFDGGVATKEDMLSIIQIVNAVPPIKVDNVSGYLNIDSLPPYPAKVLEGFKPDGREDSVLRALIKDAVKSMKDNGAVFQGSFTAPADNPLQINQFKDGLINISKQAGMIQYKLKTIQEELTDPAMVAAARKETKYWQAAYYFTLARLTARIAYVYEYNAKLGEMRKDFPARDPQIHNGWRLASREKMSDAAGEKDAKEARKFLQNLTKKDSPFRGTPWELIGRREQLMTLGLEWQPNLR